MVECLENFLSNNLGYMYPLLEELKIQTQFVYLLIGLLILFFNFDSILFSFSFSKHVFLLI